MTFQIRTFTHYSIQQAFCHIPDVVNKTYKLGLSGLAICDLESMSGCPEFVSLIEKKNKKESSKIKPVLGVTLKHTSGLFSFYALNYAGYLDITLLLSKYNFHKKNMNLCMEYVTKNMVCIADAPHEEISKRVKFFDLYSSFEQNEVYYVNEEDRLYQQIIICSKHKATLNDEKELVEQFPEYKKFFSTDVLHLTKSGNSKCANLLGLFEPYSIFIDPQIPSCIEDGKAILDPDAYLLNACRTGWKSKGLDKKVEKDGVLKKVYVDRIQEELSTITKAKISNYLLLVRDIVLFTRRSGQGITLRGSAAGCLVSYLSDLNSIDPVLPDPTLPYHPDRCLLFSRFLNAGRITEGRITLPDIDIDVGIEFRSVIRDYLRTKYGHDHVCNIITFQKMKGAGSIKEVFRVLNRPFDVANKITSAMVDEAKVQDELEDLKEDNPDYNIINYCVDHIPLINQAYQEYKYEFDIAIKLANTIRATGQHAAGVIVANRPVETFLPVDYDENGDVIEQYHMKDVELMGGVKFDLLGVAAQSKIRVIKDRLQQKGINA